MEHYNGVSIMWLEDRSVADGWAVTDSCLTGVGGVFAGKCFRACLPKDLAEEVQWSIVHYELLAIVVLVQVFRADISGKRLTFYCDNQAVVAVVNTGRAKDSLLQRLLRWLCYWLLHLDCLVHMKFVTTKKNQLADSLSRSHLGERERVNCDKLIAQWALQELTVESEFFVLQEPW